MLFDGSVQSADKRSCLHHALRSIGSVQNVPFVATPNSLLLLSIISILLSREPDNLGNRISLDG